MTTDLILPELGENIKSGIIVKIVVSVGDTIAAGDPVVEIETDKAVVEVPAEVSGVVTAIHVAEGDEIAVGQIILSVETGAVSAETGQVSTPGEKIPDTPVQETAPTVPPPAVETPARAATGQPRAESAVAGETGQAPTPGEKIPNTPVQETAPTLPPPAVETPTREATGQPRVKSAPADLKRPVAPAAPSVRRFAREIGVPIDAVSGTGPGGRISIDDIKKYSRQRHTQQEASPKSSPMVTLEPLPDFTRWGAVERQPMSMIRRKTAEHLGYAWSVIPHVTHFDTADVTGLEAFRKSFSPRVESAGGQLTVTAILLKIVAGALRVFPKFNAAIDMENMEIIYKKYVNVGIAVDTDRGLLVPVVRDVDEKNLMTLSVDLTRLAASARSGKLPLEDMQGGNFTISNLGGIGGTGFTPIVHSPEVALLGVSRAKMEMVYRKDTFEPRLMLPLTLSYDHRIIDGAEAARFLHWIVQAIEQPLLLSL